MITMTCLHLLQSHYRVLYCRNILLVHIMGNIMPSLQGTEQLQLKMNLMNF